jgi:hypothetical protein
MQRVTTEELKEIQDLRETLITIISTIGELHLTKALLTNEITEVEGNLKNQEQKFYDFQEKERVIYNKLQEKYGTGNIDLETGEITA